MQVIRTTILAATLSALLVTALPLRPTEENGMELTARQMNDMLTSRDLLDNDDANHLVLRCPTNDDDSDYLDQRDASDFDSDTDMLSPRMEALMRGVRELKKTVRQSPQSFQGAAKDMKGSAQAFAKGVKKVQTIRKAGRH